MKALDIRFVAFNAAAGLIGVAAVIFAVRSLLPSRAAPCGERYHTAMSFPLESGGALLTTAELQSRLGGRDVGVARNLVIERLQGGPVPVAMAVSLPAGAGPDKAAADNGVSFTWEPRAVDGQAAVCLSYRVRLPADFKASVGGALPGIRSADRSEGSEDSVALRPAWRGNGQGGAEELLRTAGERRTLRLEPSGFALPTGRWVKLDQELILNAPKARNGVYRIWVDGALAFERTDLQLRASPGMTVSGVAASVFYGADEAMAKAPQDTRIGLSPFEIRWQP